MNNECALKISQGIVWGLVLLAVRLPAKPNPAIPSKRSVRIPVWGTKQYNAPMSDFYTRTGDDGTTGLLGSGRIPKDHPRMEAVGSIDETSAALGVARAICLDLQIQDVILNIQRDLYGLMSEVAATSENAARFRVINAGRVAWLEQKTDQIGSNIQMPKEFIIPGDTQAGAAFSLARAIVRRAERRVAQLWHSGEIENPEILRYLNRLSSLCFVFEIRENQIAGGKPLTLAKDK